MQSTCTESQELLFTLQHCQMCALERALKNGKTIFVKMLRNVLCWACSQPRYVQSTNTLCGVSQSWSPSPAPGSSLCEMPFPVFFWDELGEIPVLSRKHTEGFFLGITHSRGESKQSIDSNFHLYFLLRMVPHSSRGSGARHCSFYSCTAFCRLTGLQELFESLIPQCFTCNKAKGGFKFFCISGWKDGVLFPRFFSPGFWGQLKIFLFSTVLSGHWCTES